MLVKQIIDNETGRRWDIIKHEENRYSVKYYEFFSSTGWRLTKTDRNFSEPDYYSKDLIEYMFEITVA